jgi:hypothetical protein
MVLHPRSSGRGGAALFASVLASALLGGCGASPSGESSAAPDAAAPTSAAARDGAAAGPRAVPTDTRGELTLEFAWTSRLVSNREFKDVTVLDRRTTITCPITAGDEATITAIAGATAAEAEANARRAEAAAPAVDPQVVAKGEALEKKMKACRKAGGSEGECGMQVMADLQADPGLVESMTGAAEATPADAALAGRFQPWFNEGCRGSMTVADQRQLDDPTIPGPEPVVHTSGTQPAVSARQARSRIAVTPMPPAVQTEIRPRFAPAAFRRAASRAAPTMRVPVAANGWPYRDAAALDVELRAVDGAQRLVAAEALAAELGDSQAFSVHSTCAAKASWIS